MFSYKYKYRIFCNVSMIKLHYTSHILAYIFSWCSFKVTFFPFRYYYYYYYYDAWIATIYSSFILVVWL